MAMQEVFFFSDLYSDYNLLLYYGGFYNPLFCITFAVLLIPHAAAFCWIARYLLKTYKWVEECDCDTVL